MNKVIVTASTLSAAVESSRTAVEVAREAGIAAHKEFQECVKECAADNTVSTRLTRNLAFLISEEADEAFAKAREEFSKAREALRVFSYKSKQGFTRSGHAIRL